MEPVTRARRFSASRSFSLQIQAAAISCPYRSRSRVSMIVVNWAADRCSRLRTSRFLRPYSGSPERPRRPYRARTTRRRTSLTAFDGQLDDVEQVGGQRRAGQHPADRRGVDAAQVDADDLDRVPPRRGGAGQPVRGVIGGAALHLAQQPLPAVQVEEAGVPPVREQGVLPGLLIDGEAGPAAAVLIDAQVRHWRRRLAQQRVRGGGERLMRDRPGDPGMPGCLGRGDPPAR